MPKFDCETQVPPHHAGELTPLLDHEAPVPPEGEGERASLVSSEEQKAHQPSFWRESAEILNLAWPGSVTAFFSFSTAIVNTAMIGHIADEALYVSAASLSSMFLNVTGFSIGFGMTGGLATLGAQAFGAKAYHRVGVLLQRTLVLELFVGLPIMFMWAFCRPILSLTGLDPAVTELASQYVAISAIGYIPAIVVEAVTQYLYCQKLVRPPIPVQLVVNIFNVACCYVTIFQLGWGFLGGAWTGVFANFLGAVGIYFVAMYVAKDTWGGISKKALEQLWPLFKLSFGSTVMMCTEWWSFEFVGFSTGYIGPDGTLSLATWGVLWQIIVILFMVSLGLADAMTIRTGNLLGEGKPIIAKHAALVGTQLAFILSVILGGILFLSRAHIARIWTGDTEIIEAVSHFLPYLCVFEVGDTLQGVLGGIASGMGKQHEASVARVFSFYCVGLPATWTLTFHYNLGMQGVMIGIIISPLVCSAALALQIFRSDWAKIAEKAIETADEH